MNKINNRNKKIIFLFITAITLIFFITKFSDYYGNNKKDSLSEMNSVKRIGNNINADWALEAMGFDTYEEKTSKNKVVVAVIDSGINLKGNNILEGKNVIDNTSNVNDQTGHGTYVSKLILKSNPNVQILPIKAIDNSENGEVSHIKSAIDYAISEDADIINLSLGFNNLSKEIEEAVNVAIEKEIPIVSAAGNNEGSLMYPASNEKVFSVIARDINNIDVAFSNKGIKRSYSAPGVHIKVDEEQYVSGTSFACSFVTASIAIIKENKKDVKIEDINNLLSKSSVDPNKYSYGVIKVDKLLKLIK